MDLTIKKLIKILINEKKFLIVFFLISVLFYPIYFYKKLNEDKVYLRVDTMYNYTIPNSISSLLSDTFINLLRTKVEENFFLDKGFKCDVKVNESTKKKTLGGVHMSTSNAGATLLTRDVRVLVHHHTLVQLSTPEV